MGFFDSVGSVAGTAWSGIKGGAIKTWDGTKEFGEGVYHTGEGTGEIIGGVFTGDTDKIKSGAEKSGMGVLNTLGGGLTAASGVVGGAVDTTIGTTNQALGEGFKAAGAEGVGNFLESDDYNRYSKLAGNVALLAVPGVGEAELANEAKVGAELTEGLSEATRTAKEADVALAEASKAVTEAEEAGTSTQEVNELRKTEEAAKVADKEAQAKVADETAELTKSTKGKFPTIRKALRTKFIRIGLEGAALDKAVDDALHLLLVGGVTSSDTPSEPSNRMKYIFLAVLILLMVILAILLL